MKGFSYMNRSDRKVIAFLLVVILVCLILMILLDRREMTTTLTASDSIVNQRAYSAEGYAGGQPRYYQVEGRTAQLFPFDPNTADSTQLLQLGLQPWQVRNIYKYRAHGGVYRSASDFGRLYGLTVEQYRALEPYIRISGDYRPATALVGERPAFGHQRFDSYDRDTTLYPIKLKPTEHIILNTADTTMLKKVPGIGSGWARQIVYYGRQLGGYVAVDQLREIDGFPEEALSYFVVCNPHPERLNLNRLTLNQLKQHPYINYYQARAITDYRRLHGDLHSLDQLSLLKEFPPHAIEILRPYVTF